MSVWIDQLASIFDNVLVFMTLITFLMAAIGWRSGSFAVGSYGGILVFSYLAINVESGTLNLIMWLVLGILVMYIAMKGANLVLGDTEGSEV